MRPELSPDRARLARTRSGFTGRSSGLQGLVILAVALAVAGPGLGSAAPGGDTAPLTLVAPDLRLDPAGDGGVVPALDGFGTTSRAGEPALPIRILLVAIPEGVTPSLRVLKADSRLVPDLAVAPVPKVQVADRAEDSTGAFGSDAVTASAETGRPEQAVLPAHVDAYIPDPGIYGRDGMIPEAPVHLGTIGYMRDQRFVEVIWMPVLYNPARREARFYTRIAAEVDFDAPAGETVPFHADPFFEAAYAGGLVNYEQGKAFRSFRRPAVSASVPASALTTEAMGAGTGTATTPVPDAGGAPLYKMMVSNAGVYRLDSTYLSSHAPDILAADPRTLAILVDGAEIPITILDAAGGSGEADGVFNAGDAIEFYGQPKTEPPTVLNYDFGGGIPSVYEANDFTDTQVYWLTASGAAGSHLRVPSVSGSPVSGYATATDFEQTTIWNENNFFLPLGGVDPFFSIPSLLAGSAAAQRDLTIALTGLAPAATPAAVTVRLRGGTDTAQNPDHRTRAWLNSDQVNLVDYTWDGETINEQTWSVPRSTLSDPVAVHLQAPGLAGVTVDRQYPDTVTIKYRRVFTVFGDVLVFTYPNQNARYTVGGLGATAPVIYEIGRTVAANGESDTTRIIGAVAGGAPTSNWTFEVSQDVSPGAPATRTFAVVGPSGTRTPDAMTAAQPAVLRQAGQSADLIVIASRDAIDATPGGALDQLLAHRLAAQGLSSKVVYIDQVYDEFSFGRRDANAVRTFLQYAYASWRGPGGTDPPPAFVLLVGDATPDFKNTLNRTDWVDQVPTPIMFQVNMIIGYYCSDNWLASINGADQIPDVHLGRISTRTPVASAAVFDKIRQFETSTPAGLWKGRAVLTAGDEKQAGEAASFQAVNDTLRTSYFSVTPYSSPSPPLYFAQPPWNSTDAAGFQTALTNELQNGAAVLTFFGHGNFDSWGLTTFFTAAMASSLTNGLKLPFMFTSNCLTGGFEFLPASGALAEAMVNNPSGGAIASFAPSGLSDAFIGSVVAAQLFQPLYGLPRQRELGPATLPVRAALWGQASIVDLQSYTFLGDPASLIATPSPPPPTGLVATAGNAQVALSWIAPAVPAASTAVYRAAGSPAGPYAAVTCTFTGPTSCTDKTALNATRYYYYVASVDGEGFAGTASNLNADCDAGPGCVTALPLNPNPPAAPGGLQVKDPGAGDRLNVSWLLNAENDIKRYTVRYGTLPGVYTTSINTNAATTQLTLTGLLTGVAYYITVTATNTSGLESAPAPEQSGVPHIFEGISPPRAISDLKVALSGSDLVLSWSRPVVDIYGRPTTTVGYRVYRGTTPNFPIIAANLLATLSDGATTSFTHTGGAALAGPGFYVVTALDASGLVSGAGRDLPNPIGDMAVTFVAPSTLHLSWVGVTTDVQGLPTLIDHYQVHVTATPVPRSSLGPSTLFLDNLTATAVDLSLPANPRFVSVLAVDNRGNLSPY